MAEQTESNITHLIKGLQEAEQTMKEQNLIDAGEPRGYTRLGPERIALEDVDALNRTDDVPDQKKENRNVANVMKKEPVA